MESVGCSPNHGCKNLSFQILMTVQKDEKKRTHDHEKGEGRKPGEELKLTMNGFATTLLLKLTNG